MIGQSALATYGDRVLAGTPVEVTVSSMGENDTHIYIQGTDYIADLGDLSDLQVSADNSKLAVASKRLRTLKTGDATAENVTSNVDGMIVGYCPSLEEIDSRNLASLTGTVDLTQCPRLRKALFEGTNVANLQIPAGSKIEELSLPDTITTLSLIRLPNLTEDNLKYNSLNALSYLRLEDNDNINNFEMLKNAYANSPALKNIRVVGFEYDADANDIAMIASFATDKDENGNPVYQGIDDNGDPTQGLPVLDGTFTLDGYLYESDYNTVKSNYPKLNIEATGFYMDFEDPEVIRVLLANMTNDDNIGITREQAESVTSISTWFSGNTLIRTFDELVDFVGVKKLDRMAFQNCSVLESIDLSNIEEYGTYALQGCTALVYDTLTLNKARILNQYAFDDVKIRKLVIPNVTTFTAGNVNDSTFGDRDVLEEIVMSSAITSIPAYCFYKHSALANVGLAWDWITAIGNYAFYNCTSLAFDELNLPNLTTLGQDAFYGVKIKKLNFGALTTLPPSTTSTQNFGDIETLEEVIFSGDITSISSKSFYNYKNLTNCSLSNSVTTIGESAF